MIRPATHVCAGANKTDKCINTYNQKEFKQQCDLAPGQINLKYPLSGAPGIGQKFYFTHSILQKSHFMLIQSCRTHMLIGKNIVWTEKEKREQQKSSLSIFLFKSGKYELRGTIFEILLVKLGTILFFFFVLFPYCLQFT